MLPVLNPRKKTNRWITSGFGFIFEPRTVLKV